MKQRMFVGFALLAAGLGLVASGGRRGRHRAAPFAAGSAGDMTEFEPAALVVIRTAFGEVNVVSRDVGHITVKACAAAALGAVQARRINNGSVRP